MHGTSLSKTNRMKGRKHVLQSISLLLFTGVSHEGEEQAFNILYLCIFVPQFFEGEEKHPLVEDEQSNVQAGML